MSIIGHLIAIIGLYCLFLGETAIGSIIVFIGGFLASKLSFSLRSCGVMIMVTLIPYGYHNEYTPTIIFLIFIGFVLACFNTRRTSQTHSDGWGIDLDFSSLGSDSDFGDGGGDGD